MLLFASFHILSGCLRLLRFITGIFHIGHLKQTESFNFWVDSLHVARPNADLFGGQLTIVVIIATPIRKKICTHRKQTAYFGVIPYGS